MIIWVDVETTCLDPMAGVLLEVAMIATTDALTKVDTVHVVLKHNELIRNVSDEFVQNMHDRNGLWDAVTHPSAVSQKDAEQKLIGFMANHHGSPMGGSSVGFDRKWLDWHMPAVAGAFHYRNIDVSTVKEMVKRWCPNDATYVPRGGQTHRALDDIRETIREAQYYRNKYFRSTQGRIG